MQSLISKETESDLTKLGLYQMVGGAIGILLITWGVYKSQQLTGTTVLMFLFISLFFVYSIFCGSICLKAKKNALAHSLLNQILQVIGFTIIGFTFKYVAGVYFSIGLNFTSAIDIDFGAGISTFNLNNNAPNNMLQVDLNVIALALIFWIDKLMKRVKDEVAVRKNAP